MRLYIFTTKDDKSLNLIQEEAKDLEVLTIYYDELSVVDGVLKWNNNHLDMSLKDRLIIRWPWLIEQDETYDYNIFVQIIVDKYSSQILMDQKCLSKYSPFYEDKLFQSFVFNDLGIKTPKTWFFMTKKDLRLEELSYPIVAKKRISSRSKHNVKLNTEEELLSWIEQKNTCDYIFQEFIDADKDLRVVVFDGQVLGIVSRDMYLRENNRMAVKGQTVYEIQDFFIEGNVLKVATYMGADFIGFDFLLDKDGNYYLIEANLSPQFVTFSRTTGINIAEKIIEKLVSHQYE